VLIKENNLISYLKKSGLGYLNTRQLSTVCVPHKKVNREKDIKIWKFIFQSHVWTLVLCYILILVQRDAIQSSLFIILQVRSTCFGCQPHPPSGVHKTVTTASGTVHNFCVQLPTECDDTRCCTIQFWPTDDEQNSARNM